MVDYRRWDRLEVSSSEDENSSKKMRVQRFAEKQRVTIGPQGISIGEEEDEEGGEKGEKITKEGENKKHPGKSKAGEAASAREKHAKDLKPQQQCQLQQHRQPREEQLLQKARREMEEEKKAAEDMIDAGGDLEEDEAFEDAHEWPRCGPLAAPLSPQEEEDEEEEEEEDKKTAGDSSGCGWPSRGRDERQQNSAAGPSSSSSKEEEEERSSASRGKKSRTEGLGSRSSSSNRTSHSGGARAAAAEVALVDNGGVVEEKYFWRQTKNEVTVDVLLPRGARGRDVCCDIKENSCCCTYKGETLLKGEFPHKVEEDEDMWLWEVVEKKINWNKLQRIAAAHNHTISAPPPPQRQQKQHSSSSTRREATEEEPHQPQKEEAARKNEAAGVEAEDTETEREGEHKETNAGVEKEEDAIFLELTLRKKPEVAGTFVWWNCVIKGDPCIDVQQIPGRASKEKTTRDFKAAWESAHRMFFEKLKNEERQRIQI